MTINISNLTLKEIRDLEKQIKEYHNSKKAVQGYKVTFHVTYLPKNHTDEKCDNLYHEEDFGDWLVNVIPDMIEKSFELKQPEYVSGFDVVKMTKEEIDDVFRG